MASDSLEKPDRQRDLVEKLRIAWDKACLHLQRFKPRDLKPWVFVPSLVFGTVTIFWAVLGKILIFFGSHLNTASMTTTCIYILPTGLGNWLKQFNWPHIGFKVFSRVLLTLYAWIALALWYYSPWGPRGQWPTSYVTPTVDNYFSTFEGATLCNIKATELFAPPTKVDEDYGYCNSRAVLLKTMSEGGRHGFDAPYAPNGCYYRWFSVEEICAILDRFEALVFVGDQNLEMVYAGFNILLRKDLQHGALRPETDADKFDSCACNSQFTDSSCREWFVRSNKDILSQTVGTNAMVYNCKGTPHAFLATSRSPASADAISKFNTLVRPTPPNNYKPIPIIHSVTSDTSLETAIESQAEFLDLADASKRKTPMLWIGPTAAGIIEIKGRRGNQEIWRFAKEMAHVAEERDVDTLGLWNLTVQADSYDGKQFGESVSIVAAMMMINWLAHLESS